MQIPSSASGLGINISLYDSEMGRGLMYIGRREREKEARLPPSSITYLLFVFCFAYLHVILLFGLIKTFKSTF